MSDLISRKYLYDKMLEKEELARQRVLDTPTHSPAYLRYVAQFNERTALKHEIADAPPVEAVPVVHGEWVKTFRYMRENINTGKLEPVYSCDCPICKWHTGNQGTRFNFCPNCGADMRTSAE